MNQHVFLCTPDVDQVKTPAPAGVAFVQLFILEVLPQQSKTASDGLANLREGPRAGEWGRYAIQGRHGHASSDLVEQLKKPASQKRTKHTDMMHPTILSSRRHYILVGVAAEELGCSLLFGFLFNMGRKVHGPSTSRGKSLSFW